MSRLSAFLQSIPREQALFFTSEGWSFHWSSNKLIIERFPRHVSECLSWAPSLLFINLDLLFIQKNFLLNYIFNTEALGLVLCSPPLSGVNDINMSSQLPALSLSSLSKRWQTSSLHLNILILSISCSAVTRSVASLGTKAPYSHRNQSNEQERETEV